MNNKLIAILLIVSLMLTFVSCGELVPPAGGGVINPPSNETPDDNQDNGDQGGNGGEDNPDKEVTFTVSLMLGGELYVPESTDGDEAIKVRWSNGHSFHTEIIGADGMASTTELDGDYSVSVIGIPEGYTYNPNIYKATNSSPNVIIDLLKITKTRGLGNGLYGSNCIQINKTGVYRATMRAENSVVYYEFTPTKAGVYSIESMVDISAEMYNPLVNIYNGTSAAKFLDETRDGGGVSGNYTTNFQYTVKIAEEFLGGCYTFGIFVNGKDAVYPTYVDFEIKYLGDYQYDSVKSEMIYTEFIPNYQKINKNGNLEFDSERFALWYAAYVAYLEENMTKYGGTSYTDAAIRIDGKRVFDEKYYKLNPEDGYYHVYDTDKYAAYGGWGPILYADISSACIFMELPFNQVEYQGNKALTVCEGTENYKLFIEGYNELIIPHGDSGPFLCNKNCPCFISGANGGSCAIEDNCTKCKSTCRHLPREYKFQRGYADIAINGRCPVTEELKDFLQKYSENQRLFSDGNGWAEQHSPRYDSYEDSQWLFACGYYS